MSNPLRSLRCAALLLAGPLTAFLFAQAPAAPTAPVTPYAPKAPANVTLKDAFKDAFVVGVAVRPDQINSQNAQSVALIQREFNSIVAENAMKMGPIHPRPGNDDSSYNWADADAIVDFGVKNKMFVIGHNLCWHSQMPGWMGQPEAGQTELTKEVLSQRLKDHIYKVVGRYKGKVNGWDVVNEALADNAGQAGDMPYGLRANSPFNRVFRSPEYILLAFKWAHEVDPNTELYYNDYNLDAVDRSDYKRANAIALIKYLKENGAHVSGVGLQGHYNMATPSIGKIDETIGMFAALGVKVHITELDVTDNRGNEVSGAVGFNPNNPNPAQAAAKGAAPAATANAATPPAAPQGARGPGRGGRGGGLPAIDALKTDVKLTDAQVAAITPILEKTNQDIAASMASSDFSRVAQLREEALAAMRKLVNADQQAALATAMTPPARGGRGPAAPVVPLTPERAEEQAKRYGEIFQVFLKHKAAIDRVTFWGLRDTDSWRRQNHPLIFTDDYGRKPAYDAVIHALTLTGAKK